MEGQGQWRGKVCLRCDDSWERSGTLIVLRIGCFRDGRIVVLVRESKTGMEYEISYVVTL